MDEHDDGDRVSTGASKHEQYAPDAGSCQTPGHVGWARGAHEPAADGQPSHRSVVSHMEFTVKA